MAQNFIVTGAGSGIGHALTKRLLAQGHKVCACDINEAALTANFTDISEDTRQRLMTQILDVRSVEAWQSVVDAVLERWHAIDVLCNVAGVLKDNWVTDIKVPTEVDMHFDINVKGSIYGTQSVIAVMRRQGRGHIINLASVAALSPVPGLSLYSASKFAIRSYSLAAGMELKKYNIAVTTVCPDAVQTPMLDQQKDKEQAALTFSGSRSLSVDEVVDEIVGPILDKRPLEVVLPPSRGLLTKVANAFPNLSQKNIGMFQKLGKRRQAKSR